MDQIDRVQLILGLVVLGREVLYIVFTLIALLRNPAFLLVNVGAKRGVDTSEFIRHGLMFTLTPEKYVALAAFCGEAEAEEGCDAIAPFIRIFFIWVLLSCDCCAVAALVVGAMNYLPLPLAVGYSVTGLAGLTAMPVLFVDCD